MKTAISLPDELFAQAERVARRQHKSRSQLYRDAVEEYLIRHDALVITRRIDEIREAEGDAYSTWEPSQLEILRDTEW